MAAEKWAGFTDEDIKRLQINPEDKDNHMKKSKSLKLSELGKECEETKIIGIIEGRTPNSNSEDTIYSSKLKIKCEEILISDELENVSNSFSIRNNESFHSDDRYLSSDSSKKENLCEKDFCSNNNLQELEIFEARQKRIEAENARRRVLINKAISDKKKHTQAEAFKLAKITEELQKIDSVLSADVSILRNYIEKASMEFTDAEKRYLRAEREFIEAKLLLYERMQRKEQLTEHLCAIIEQNENRKANKLVELMKQLEMEAIVESCDIDTPQPILSKLCILNDDAYHCCQTLRPTSQTENLRISEQNQSAEKLSDIADDTNIVDKELNTTTETTSA